MINNFLTKKILIALFILSLFLIAVNIVFDKLKHKNAAQNKAEISSALIDSVFINCLNKFSIDERFLKKIKPPNKKGDSLKYSYSITIPVDLPIPSILTELQKDFSFYSIQFNSVEKENYFSTLLISSENKNKLYAEFLVNNNLHREEGKISFLLLGYENLNDDEKVDLLNSSINFSIVFQPSNKNINLPNDFLLKRKEGILLLNDDIEDINYKLKKNFSKIRFRSVLSSIYIDFPKINYFLVDDKSDLYNSDAYAFIKKYFAKVNRSLFPMSKFINLNSKNDEELILKFNDEMKNSNRDSSSYFLINANDLKVLQHQLKTLKMKGVKINLFSELQSELLTK